MTTLSDSPNSRRSSSWTRWGVRTASPRRGRSRSRPGSTCASCPQRSAGPAGNHWGPTRGRTHYPLQWVNSIRFNSILYFPIYWGYGTGYIQCKNMLYSIKISVTNNGLRSSFYGWLNSPYSVQWYWTLIILGIIICIPSKVQMYAVLMYFK